MAVTLRILPEHGLAYVRYTGRMEIAECAEAFRGFVAHPDFRKGLKQLVDLSDITDWDHDFAGLMKHQAREAEIYDNPLEPVLIVGLAPTELGQSVARLVNRAWQSSHRVVPLVVETEREALAVLGIELPSIAALLLSA